jgi:hypothetical protein
VTDVLDRLDEAGDGERVSVADIVAELGDRSFAPLLLVPALLMVSPISSIPGTPTMSGAVIALIVVQMILGREAVWLPRFLRDRSLPAHRLDQAVAWLRRPAGWLERIIRPRLGWLTRRPFSYVVLATCFAITLVMPVMELLPAFASIAAFAISLFAIGLLARDGVFVLVGFAVVAAGAAVAASFT